MKSFGMRKVVGSVAAGAIAVGLVIATASSASATPATINASVALGAGTLTLNAPSTLTFPSSTIGTNQTLHASLPLDIQDNTGSAAGWNVTLTSTTFTSGSDHLANNSTTDTGATGVCDNSITCTLGGNSAVSYPLVVPAASVAPTAIQIQDAALGTGMAGQTWTHTMALVLPANTAVGNYTSTWTYSLVSGP